MIYRLHSTEDLEVYAYLKDVLKDLKLNKKKYWWFISDFVCEATKDETIKFSSNFENILTTKELMNLLKCENLKFDEGVFCAIPMKFSKEQIKEFDSPVIEDVNEERPYASDEPYMQHPLSCLEISVWESIGMTIVSDDEKIIKRFKKVYPNSTEEFPF